MSKRERGGGGEIRRGVMVTDPDLYIVPREPMMMKKKQDGGVHSEALRGGRRDRIQREKQ